jgi:hypothetical protein
MWKLLNLFIAHKIVHARQLRPTALHPKAWRPSLRIQRLVLAVIVKRHPANIELKENKLQKQTYFRHRK